MVKITDKRSSAILGADEKPASVTETVAEAASAATSVVTAPVKAVGKAFNVVKILAWFGAGLAIFSLFFYFAKLAPKIGEVYTTKTITITESWQWTGFLTYAIGIRENTFNYETLIILLALAVIIAVATADILRMFSTFSDGTSWTIGIGLAILCGASGITPLIMVFFIGTAILGVWGIGLIIIGAFIAAVTLNWGIGGTVRRWRLERQAEIDSLKTQKGTSKVTDAIRALKETQAAYKGNEALD